MYILTKEVIREDGQHRVRVYSVDGRAHLEVDGEIVKRGSVDYMIECYNKF